jgi:hypothetical protein
LVLDAGVTEEELLTIEFKLQMAPETKLPYSWVNQALQIRKLFNIKNSYDAVAQAMGGMAKEADIKARLAGLDEAEIYLREYLKMPGAYDKIEQHEQHFFNMQGRITPRTGASEKSAARAIGHVLAKNSTELEDRVHELREAFGKELKAVVGRLAGQHGWKPTRDNDSFFGDDTTDEEGILITAAQKLREADDTQSKRIALDIKEIVQDLRDAKKDEKIASAALTRAQTANRLLQEIDLDSAPDDNLAGLCNQLSAIIKRASQLKDEAERIPARLR